MITNLGDLTLGECSPGALALQGAGLAGIGLALPNLLAQIAALQAWTPQPINLSVSLNLAHQIVLGIEAAINFSLPVPDISAMIALIKALLDALLNILQTIQIHFDFLASFNAHFSTGGIQALRHQGAANSCGTELNGVVPDAAYSESVILMARAPEARGALNALMVVA